jgi:hypothetical protein
MPRTYKHQITVVRCVTHDNNHYLISIRLPWGTLNNVQYVRTTGRGKHQITWPKSPVQIKGGSLMFPAFNPARGITRNVIRAIERHLEGRVAEPKKRPRVTVPEVEPEDYRECTYDTMEQYEAARKRRLEWEAKHPESLDK